ncbi:MAG: tRNA uridine-5-carboxymethylaminomethyl(34) synthesis GTPase MnmE, partial [Thermodesulfobacteriota bacterium]|nr:tRNA uridine-5-carboxymethylaminomethyl(34) synthesis GTPase MnmE [Thermodesulfobacteriota bacterium]
AEKKISEADLVLFLVDASKKLDELDSYVRGQCAGLPVFQVLTKADIAINQENLFFCEFPSYRVSSKTGEGLDLLRQAISTFLVGDYLPSSESVLLTERRHYEALLFSFNSLERVTALLDGGSPLELVAFELREALYHLGQISGETTTESLLDDIFSGFCIGK